MAEMCPVSRGQMSDAMDGRNGCKGTSRPGSGGAGKDLFTVCLLGSQTTVTTVLHFQTSKGNYLTSKCKMFMGYNKQFE